MFQSQNIYKFYCFLFIQISLSLLVLSQSQIDCQVTATLTLNNCFRLCRRKYVGEKDFYNFNNKKCQKKVTCGKGTYLEYQQNICADQNTYHTLKAFGMTISTQQKQIFQFYLLQIVNGKYLGTQYKCDEGWKSSLKIQKASSIANIVYLCDMQLKDGEIYPKTHGQYFFQKLQTDKQIQAMNIAYGQDTFLTGWTFFNLINLILSIIFILLGIFQCFLNANKKINKKCQCFSKDKQQEYQLTKQQKQQLQNYLKNKIEKQPLNQNGFSYKKFLLDIKQKKKEIQNYQKSKNQKKKNIKKNLNADNLKKKKLKFNKTQIKNIAQ